MYVWWKEKKTVFLYNEKKKNFLWELMYKMTDWETTLLGHYMELGCWLEVFLILVFWILLHQGTHSILCSRIQGYILSFMNEVDPCLMLPLYVLYGMQNQIFQQLVSERSSISCLYNMWLGFRIKENHLLLVSNFCSSFFLHNVLFYKL